MDVDKMTRDELRAYCQSHKLPGYSRLRVPELRTMVADYLRPFPRVVPHNPWRPSAQAWLRTRSGYHKR